jgi:hypothetical protein
MYSVPLDVQDVQCVSGRTGCTVCRWTHGALQKGSKNPGKVTDLDTHGVGVVGEV